MIDEDIAEKSVIIIFLRSRRSRWKRKKKNKSPRFWVRDIFRQSEQYGEYSN